MKKIVLILFFALAFCACKHDANETDNAPLPLTVENLAGKWVLEGNNTKWYEFKTDGSCVEKNNTTDNLFYSIKNNAVQLYLDSTHGTAGNTLHIRIFKQYCFISINNTPEKRYNKN